MEKKVLVVKTVVSVMAIIFGIVIFSLGVTCAAYGYSGVETLLGIIISLCAIALIFSAIFKIVCYQMLISESNKEDQAAFGQPIQSGGAPEVETLKKKLLSLQILKNEGFISKEEYETMRADIINKNRH